MPETLASAIQELEAASLMVGQVQYARSATVAAGNVISQAPAAGVQVGLWSAVSFIVSLGPLNSTATITVPNIVGLQQYLAQSTLAAAGCAPGTVTYQTSLSVAAGLVISQSVTGAGQPAGVQVNYVVSLGNPGPLLNPPNGPPLVSVPDLTT